MMDPLYAPWGVAAPSATRDRTGSRRVQSAGAFSFGEPARGLHALRQEWAPALDLFDIDRPDDAPPAPLALAKLIGLVACLTGLAGLLVSTVAKAVAGLLTG